MPIKVDKETTKLPVRGKNNYSHELESINSSLQKEYEKYKRKEILKEVYLQEKQKLLLKKQELEQELEKESISKPLNEIPVPSEEVKITKEIVDAMVEKIVVSRYESIEIHLIK
jgi:hypothetical protein